MYRNLRAEMARSGITIKDISGLLNVRYATVCDKLNGKYRFYYDEASIIRCHFFAGLDLEYLFDSEEQSHDEKGQIKLKELSEV